MNHVTWEIHLIYYYFFCNLTQVKHRRLLNKLCKVNFSMYSKIYLLRKISYELTFLWYFYSLDMIKHICSRIYSIEIFNVFFLSVLILIPCGFCQLKIHHQITHRTVDVATIALHEGIVRSIHKIDRQMTVLIDVWCIICSGSWWICIGIILLIPRSSPSIIVLLLR